MSNFVDKLKSVKLVSCLVDIIREYRCHCAVKREKASILQEAIKRFPQEYTIDATKRNGVYVFHNMDNSLINRGEVYEPEVQQALVTLISMDRLRNKKTVFADVGANIGLHTVFLKNIYPELEIIAFDPSPFSWMYLELTLELNKIHDVHLQKIALSDTNGRKSFHNWGEESSADSLENTNRVTGTRPNIIEVESKRLDDIATSLPCPTVIKMDCEGAELSILKGAKQSIEKNKPFILLEAHPVNMRAYNVRNGDLFRLLAELQYTMLSLKFEVLDIARLTAMQEALLEDYIIIPNEFISAKTKDQY